MKRIVCIYLALLTVASSLFALTPVNFSLWYPMSFNKSEYDDVNVNIGVLYSRFGGLKGFSVNGGLTDMKDNCYGLAISGAGHRIEGEMKGVMIGIISGVSFDHAGLDVSLLNLSASDFTGCKISLMAVTGEEFRGLASGLINWHGEDLYGVETGLFNTGGGDSYGAQIGGANYTGGNLYGVSIGGLVVANGSMMGVSASGVTIIGDFFKGVNVSGAFLSSYDFKGVSTSGLFYTGGTMKGFTAAAANITRKDFQSGVQAGAANFTGGCFSGIQAGAANIVAGGCSGLQVGSLNMVGGNFRGFQAGVVNITGGTSRGLSLGTVIVAQEQKGVPVAPVMLSGNGEIGVDYTYNNFCPVNIGAKFVSNNWYAISSIGYGDALDDASDALVISGYWGRQFRLGNVRLGVDLGNIGILNDMDNEEQGIYDKDITILRGRLGYRLRFAELYATAGYAGILEKDGTERDEDFLDGWSDPYGEPYFGAGVGVHLFQPGK